MKLFNSIWLVIPIILTLSFTVNQANTNKYTNAETFEGELYFKLVDFGSYYGASDSQILKFEAIIDSLQQNVENSLQDQLLLDNIQTLKDNHLINKPYFHLKIDSTSVYRIYLSESEFQKIKIYKRQNLINEHKKIKVKLNGIKINESIVSCSSISSTTKVEGETEWSK